MRFNKPIIAWIGYFFLSVAARAEIQTTLSMTAPTLDPGQQSSFTANQASGPAGSTTSTLVNPYAGVNQFILSAGTGRFASLSGTRYGINFDTFHFFQSFLSPQYFSVLSSNTSCPAATNYSYLLMRYRTFDAPRDHMDPYSINTRVGGYLNYNPAGTPVFTTSNTFDLVGPTVDSTTYGLTNSSFGACASGAIRLLRDGTLFLDRGGRVFFGNTFAVFYGSGGNPVVATMVPQTTLTVGMMSNLANHVFSGILTQFTSKSSQTQVNLYAYPDAAGTTFTLRTINSFSDPTSYSSYGTLTCTTLNSPLNGFCRGLLTLDGVTGSSNVICHIGSTSSQDLLACTSAKPDNTKVGISFIATRSVKALLSVAVPSTAASTAPSTSTTIAATLQNLTGTYISTMANPAVPAQQLQAPFSNPGAYSGAGGTCGSTLKGFSSCTLNITYAPSAVGTSLQIFRSAYNDQTGTVNATTNVIGTSGLSSLAISPNSSFFANGGSQQFTATATYSDNSTQNVTSAVNWASSASSVIGLTSSGAGSFLSTGSSNLSASLAAVNTSFTATVYDPAPNPTGLTATPASQTQINLGWTSGGGTTSAFQIAYQIGATAPSDCNSGTVITSGVVGNVTSYNITGLSPNTQYSFRVCSVNGTVGQLSSGATASASTNSSQLIFATANTYTGNLGGLFFADFICQQEAVTAGLSGVWRAVLSDGTTSATSRISLTLPVYNFRPISAGGAQLFATTAAFWSGTLSNAVNYNASGGSPGAVITWSGSTTAGANNGTLQCSAWTTNSSGTTGRTGNNNATNASAFNNATNTCNNAYSLYCINGQSSAAAPANPSGFLNSVTSSTSIQFSWSSGGGTTAAYKLAYRTGGTAPVDCNSNTVIGALTLGYNPTTYTVTGLTPSTQYSFRLCAVNSDQSSASSGTTLTVTTTASGSVTNLGTRQVIFSTSNTYNGSFGGIYFADYICQQEAASAGLNGIWKSVTSDESTSATSRLSIPSDVYNNRPTSAGGYQQVAANSAAFWGSSFAYSINYNAGGTSPGNNNTWTGSTTAGAINAGRTCTNWTTSSSGTNGQIGPSNNTGNLLSTAQATCNNSYSLYCVNQQSASAAPPDPANLLDAVITNSSVQLTWTSGGGTTAGYRLAYRTGGTAPADCNSNTVISTATLGINPTSYTVTGLAASTQYSFRLCAVNSDESLLSSGITVTTTTTTSGTLTNLGSRQVVFSTSATYAPSFGGLFFGDFICQREATTAGLAGVWKAILSDESTSAISRISIPGVVYNNRPVSSGGYQQVAANSSSFWSATMGATLYYNASGGNPGNTLSWTGTSTAGAIVATRTCSSWTTANSGQNGQAGNTNTTGNVIATNQNACTNSYSLLCINQQTASGAPSDPSGFTASVVASTSALLSWTSGGGTTAGYKLAYQTGGTAPANCTSGTVVAASTLGVNPTSYTVTGLTASTQYSFRLCAVNSDESSVSAGTTLTITTPASGQTVTLGSRQIVFATTSTYNGNVGGLPFADFICQNEATNGGLTGVWRAILSDESTSATSRLTIGSVYNNRPLSSGGYQLLAADSASFWSGALQASLYYSASGGVPGSTIAWTGSTVAGAINATRTCTNWTTSSSGGTAQFGTTTNVGNPFANGNTTCDTLRTFYCTNQQSSPAAPPNPSGFTNLTYSSTNAQFSWTSGGGTTAGYIIAYQTGGTAPANCSTGTVIPATTIGVNPSAYTVTGLSASTQYSFRLCAVNSDQSSVSSGVTLSVTTTASGTVTNLGSRQVVFATAATYTGNFGGLFFADYICQQNASAAGLNGIWKAVMSDNSTSALSRISVAGAVYNNRPSGSGGYQLLANNSTEFWASSFPAIAYYNASGTTPGSNTVWTGSTGAGAINTGNTCSNWTSSGPNPSLGARGNTNTTGNIINSGNSGCNNVFSLFCTNQQSAAATPSNPTGFTNYATGSTSVGLVWASGGGTTAAYRLAYQTGGTAPANCSSGTVISDSVLGVNPTSYVVTGLSASTQYSFRLCAYNSDLSANSTGVTLSVTTLASGSTTTINYGTTQVVFQTHSTYLANVGGLHFSDFICNRDASSAGLSGTWKAILSDDSTSATSRITIPGAVYNNRPISSGGIQLMASNSSEFWTASYPVTFRYNASGTTPVNVFAWTGSTSAGGISAGNTCTGWTTNSALSTGTYGRSDLTLNTASISNATTACNNNVLGFYCINRQSSPAAPSNPASFTQGTVTNNSIGLNWTSGGGTTAAYRLAYQTGGTAPANCSSGTVVSAATLGVNPVTYTVTGLSAGTQYSFRLCAQNSDLSSTSSGVTLSVTTTSLSAPANQTIFATTTSYRPTMGGLYFADFICQQEAITNGNYSGVWKAIMADSSSSASGRIALSATIWNNRPAGSGGAQQVATSGAFWSSAWTANVNYTAAQAAPPSNNTWTGTTTAGAVNATRNCSDWTTNAAGTQARFGNSSSATSAAVFDGGNSNCNNSWPIYCINQQTASATPSDPTGFSAVQTGSDSIAFVWANGGGTTAAYQMAYQAGGTAPADCTLGTIIPAATIGINNPTTYTVTGLSASTQYSFRLCAANSDLSSYSSGVTATVTTSSSGTSFNLGTSQFIFTTTNTFTGNLGGLFFADYICQNEATNAGLSGIWKAILSDGTTSALSRLNISSQIFNFRPLSSGGPQRVSDSTNIWNSLMYNSANLTAQGVSPSTTIVWTGTTNAGANAANHCSAWTTVSSGVQGQYGTSNSTTQLLSTGGTTCNTSRALYCINQQTAAAAPSDPTNFYRYSTGPTSLGFTWASGGGTTAAYTLAYQTGGTAPANCSSGTVISPSTIGYNATTYTVAGLASSTQYSFRLCALNSDLSLASAGVTLTATTALAAGGITIVPGSLQMIFSTTATYYGNFGGIYVGDFICQQEAVSAGLPGIWKSITGDEATSASSRLSISGSAIYNLRGPDSGGIQQLSNGTGFWGGPWAQNANFSAVSGASPGVVRNWTGTTATGAINTGNTCTSWTTSSSGASGAAGYTTTPATGTYNTTNTCNNLNSLLCINQQSSSAAPSDPASFSSYSVSSNSASFVWTSGGGTTAAFKIAYQTGGTAPANCSSGTVVAASVVGINTTSYTVTGLSPSTQYSFRLCAINSDESLTSSGLTVTTTTTASGTSYSGTTQQIFTTTNAYTGANFGGIYFADYICQQEAVTAGYAGVWKAIIGDESTSAVSRITLNSAIYNTRSSGAGGIQFLSNGTAFWSGPWSNNTNFTASGGAPTVVRNWTGTTNTGAINAGNTCTSWTTQSNSVNGMAGYSTTPTAGTTNALNNCNTQNGFYCINQQTASATPADPTGFEAYALETGTIGLKWLSGGGTTAAYQIAYQTGGTAPANCASGTIITDTQIGINANAYAVTGLSSGTQYSFRLCAYNSDLSASSSGVTVTASTLSSGPTSYSFGTSQLIFSTAAVYQGNFGGIYFADFACQIEADSAGLGGIWQAIIGDNSTSAVSRLSLDSVIFNNRSNASGGIQKISNGTQFFGGPWLANSNYTAISASPGVVRNWTGVTNTGAVSAGNNCTNWTYATNAVNGTQGNSTSPTAPIATGGNACSTYNSFYCINRQAAAASPPNPATFSNYSSNSSSIGLIWSSGGGTTAAYQLAYRSGATPPVDCSSNTVVSATTLGVNPKTYTVTGLSASTQYSFRLCALNSDLSLSSSGLTLTVTTPSSGTVYDLSGGQFIFSTQGTYYPMFGGVTYADFICQQEAETAGLSGTWFALLSDASTAASARVSLSGDLFNLRSVAAGGAQWTTNSTSYFGNGNLANGFYFTASGTTPGNSNSWTGTTNAGAISAGNTCSSWTTSALGTNGLTGRSNVTVNYVSNQNIGCNNARGLFCINQQSSPAAPSNPASFDTYEIGTTFIGFTFSSGGGTTAGYTLAYQAGGTAPANCNSGTVVSATTIGTYANSYLVTGLSSSTQYSFRLCAVNSDRTSFSSGVTLTVTTAASGFTFNPASGNQFVFATAASYSPNFGGLNFADFICQQEAANASLGGIWKAVLGDSTTSAVSRISVASNNIFNLGPTSSGGSLLVATSSYFFSGVLARLLNFSATGSSPATTRVWTGAAAGGAIGANHCSNWTTNSGGTTGAYGLNTSQTAHIISNNAACNVNYSLLCINQQTASSQPPNPASFTNGAITTSSIAFNWSSGGGTTAGYQLAYQLGASPPSTCSTGTTVLPSVLGVNPTTYTVTGLTSATQYSFRLCAINSDQSLQSGGLTLTLTTN